MVLHILNTDGASQMKKILKKLRKRMSLFCFIFFKLIFEYDKLPKFIMKNISQAYMIKLHYKNDKKINAEKKEVLDFIDKFGLRQYPYPFDLLRNQTHVEVFHDNEKNLPYVLHDKKRLYMPLELDDSEIRSIYSCLAFSEQHPKSPHCYLANNFTVNETDTVVDIGACEGIFALSVIDMVKNVILIECDPRWQDPLKATFEPYKSKVEIISKFAGNITNKNMIKLDDLLMRGGGYFIKMDVEGHELQVLSGGEQILSSANKSLKLAVAAYHRSSDEKRIGMLLKKHKFSINHSYGYMIPLGKNLFTGESFFSPPYLKRGVIYAEKKLD